jgi:hypothetical protein
MSKKGNIVNKADTVIKRDVNEDDVTQRHVNEDDVTQRHVNEDDLRSVMSAKMT